MKIRKKRRSMNCHKKTHDSVANADDKTEKRIEAYNRRTDVDGYGKQNPIGPQANQGCRE